MYVLICSWASCRVLDISASTRVWYSCTVFSMDCCQQHEHRNVPRQRHGLQPHLTPVLSSSHALSIVLPLLVNVTITRAETILVVRRQCTTCTTDDCKCFENHRSKKVLTKLMYETEKCKAEISC